MKIVADFGVLWQNPASSESLKKHNKKLSFKIL